MDWVSGRPSLLNFLQLFLLHVSVFFFLYQFFSNVNKNNVNFFPSVNNIHFLYKQTFCFSFNKLIPERKTTFRLYYIQKIFIFSSQFPSNNFRKGVGFPIFLRARNFETEANSRADLSWETAWSFLNC